MPRARAVMVDMEPKVRTSLHRKLNVASLCVPGINIFKQLPPMFFFEVRIFLKKIK